MARQTHTATVAAIVVVAALRKRVASCCYASTLAIPAEVTSQSLQLAVLDSQQRVLCSQQGIFASQQLLEQCFFSCSAL
eukprot:18346-Heterococcus_DN1.PRE.1